MVTEAFAVMAAVSGTVGTINIVKGWIAELRQLLREHRNAGETLLELYLGFDKCRTELDLWMRDVWRGQANLSALSERALGETRHGHYRNASYSYLNQ
jgi:hypothetical protein